MKQLLIYGLAFLVIGAGYYFYKKPKYIYGESAPNFKSTTPEGKTLSLSDFKGQLILLDFWGSWCPPCRQESPDLVKLHQKFHGKSFKKATNFDILSVGIETDKSRWINAIQKDNLYWPNHVSGMQRLKDPIALLYGVREIPTKYLIDEKGMIIAVNPTFSELNEMLTQQLQ